jgi:hypothetical protein
MILPAGFIFYSIVLSLVSSSARASELSSLNHPKNQDEELVVLNRDIGSLHHPLKANFDLTATLNTYPLGYTGTGLILGLICVDPDKNIYASSFDTTRGAALNGIQIYKLSKLSRRLMFC